MAVADDHKQRKDRTEEFRAGLDSLIVKGRQSYNRFAGGIAKRHCPICNYFGQFGPYGVPPRFDARCPSCNSLERHRLISLCLTRLDLLAQGQRFLHFAAEWPLRRVIESKVGSYETAELRADTNPTHILNIEAIALPENSIDRVMCNHVLEHVDDTKALAEVFRILVPGGVAIFTVPIVDAWEKTYENPAVTSDEDRTRHFGQHNHVRYYGQDLHDRIRAAGFILTDFVAVEPDVLEHGLIRGETVFVARKPEVPA